MIASSYLFLIKNEKILLSRRFQTGYQDGKFSLPAGHVEDQESVTAALCREVTEEIGLKILPKDAQLVHVMHRREDDIRMDFFFTAKRWRGALNNCEPKKCDLLKWFPLNRLPSTTIPYIRHAIKSYRKHIFFSEFGWQSA